MYPVSSSAQLALLPWLARWDPPADRTRFAAGLHAGSALGLAVALRHDLRALDASAVRRLALSSLPAAVTGLATHDVVERRFGTPGRTAGALALAGVALWLADSRTSTSDDLCDATGALTRRTSQRSLRLAALAQAVALVPGVSRTGATLTALRASGVPREDALRSSLVMSLPVAVGAAGLTAVRGREAPPLVPTALAAGSAFVAARRVTATRGFVRGSVLFRLALAGLVVRRLREERR